MIGSLTVVTEQKRFSKLIHCALLFLFFTSPLAQTKLADLSVNDTPSDAGSFYFAELGNTQDAFAEAQGFAAALGLSFSISENGALALTNGDTSLTFEISNNAETGLAKRSGAMTHNGAALTSPSAIFSGGVYYVPVSPVAQALGGSSTFNYDSSTLQVSTPDAAEVASDAQTVENAETQVTDADATDETASSDPVTDEATEADVAGPDAINPDTANPDTVQTQTTSNDTAFQLAEPRIGQQEDGSTRVVVEIPSGGAYNLAVKDNVLVVSFPGMTGTAFERDLQGQNISSLAYGSLENGDFALFVRAQHPLSLSGAGFRSGVVAADTTERLFIDFAPDLQGEAVIEASSSEPGDAPPPAQAAPKIVVIDAGHGGHDPGAASGHGQEKEVVLAVALKLRDLLVAQGVEVIMTRDGDNFLELQERADFANPNINLFISLHVNAVAQTSASGVETWVFGVPLEQSTLSRAIEENGGGAEGEALTQDALTFANSIQGKIVQEEQLRYSLSLAEEVQAELVSATGSQDRGIKKAPFAVIRNARTAAILVELGFISNPDEGSKLVTDAYQTTLATTLAKAIQDFLSEGLVASQP